ncbi:MAG: Flp family type IVb pilin [Phycisphaerales bacterium]|nr:Flp family type IVb pilin [Phycisphaerales bacterium]
MKQFRRVAARFLKSEDGPSAVEYGVLLALLVVIALSAISLLGEKAGEVFNGVSDDLSEAKQAAGS